MILSCMRVLFCFTVRDVILMHCAQACLWKMVSRFLKLADGFLKVIMKKKPRNRTIRQLLHLVIVKYRDILVSS